MTDPIDHAVDIRAVFAPEPHGAVAERAAADDFTLEVRRADVRAALGGRRLASGRR